MRTNFILIDSENVKPEYIEKLNEEHFRVVVFVGANQKIHASTANAVQPLGSNGRYIQIASNGRNALDFHIAYYIGRLSADDPNAYFHIISKDKGFDPLIEHLRNEKIFCSRSPSILEIPLFKPTPKQLATEFYEKRIAQNKARPATVTSLQNTILAHFERTLSADQVVKVVKALTAAGYIVVNGKKISYTDQSSSGPTKRSTQNAKVA